MNLFKEDRKNKSKILSAEDLANKLANCNLIVCTNSGTKTAKLSIKEIMQSIETSGVPTVITFSPSPFLQLPAGWMDNQEAIGCTAQLTYLNNLVTEKNVCVYAINHSTIEEQQGETGLIQIKKLLNITMISDADRKLTNFLGLDTFTLENNQQSYLKRFSLVIMPKGQTKIFDIQIPANAGENAKQHALDIENFITKNSPQAQPG